MVYNNYTQFTMHTYRLEAAKTHQNQFQGTHFLQILGGGGGCDVLQLRGL